MRYPTPAQNADASMTSAAFGECAPNVDAPTISVTAIKKAIATFAPNLNDMTAIIIMVMLIKSVLLALGILAWNGHSWAFALFVGLAATALLFDLILLLVARCADKDIERGGGL